LAAERVQAQPGDLQYRRTRVRAPPVQGAQTHDQLAQLERLGQVVVRAELEARDLVVEPIGGGEHHDRDAAARRHDPGGDLVSGRAGDVAVDHREVVGVDGQQLQGGVAVT